MTKKDKSIAAKKAEEISNIVAFMCNQSARDCYFPHAPQYILEETIKLLTAKV